MSFNRTGRTGYEFQFGGNLKACFLNKLSFAYRVTDDCVIIPEDFLI
jgi:hypothetical protein